MEKYLINCLHCGSGEFTDDPQDRINEGLNCCSYKRDYEVYELKNVSKKYNNLNFEKEEKEKSCCKDTLKNLDTDCAMDDIRDIFPNCRNKPGEDNPSELFNAYFNANTSIFSVSQKFKFIENFSFVWEDYIVIEDGEHDLEDIDYTLYSHYLYKQNNKDEKFYEEDFIWLEKDDELIIKSVVGSHKDILYALEIKDKYQWESDNSKHLIVLNKEDLTMLLDKKYFKLEK